MNNKFKNKIFILFLLMIPISLIATNKYDTIYNSHVWKSLVHFNNSTSNINDPTFLLSFDDFSLENELLMTIKDFENGKNICKYPARYMFLSKKIIDNNFKKFNCPEFSDYLNQISANSIDLVFSAENISSPSSMMGHVFFKINGQKNNYNLENAVSFFTIIDTFNIPLLILKSTVLGMKGLFILNPYKQQIYKYLYEENRSIYEYKLELNQNQKNLILYHFWELKDLNMKYYFTGFNCATMIDDILSLTNKDYKKDFSLWITPKDVIKNAKENNLIKSFKMIPSIEWELHMLLENIDNEDLEVLVSSVNNFNFKNIQEYSKNSIHMRFIEIYSQYKLINDEINIDNFKLINSHLNQNIKYELDLTNYKNPLNTFNDSQLSFSKNLKEDLYNLKFLGASNTLNDDNREYFSENSLKIGEIDLSLEKENIDLDSFVLYEMKSLLPWNNVTKSYSKYFNISYNNNYDLKNKKMNIVGGIGISYKFHNDVLFYSMMNAGTKFNFNDIDLISSFENGLLIYELFNMKSYLNFEIIYDSKSNEINSVLNFNQSLYDDVKEFKIDFNYKKLESEEKFIIGYTYFF